MDFKILKVAATIKHTMVALKANGINAYYVDNGEEAKRKVLQLIPKGAEVMTMSSVSLEATGITKAINESDNYNSVKNKLSFMDRSTQGLEMQKLGAAPEYTVGSVHAVTEDGKVVVASNTGSQLPAYIYGSANVIWVVGVQKIVKDLEEALKRIYDYILPLESNRLKKLYNITANSNVSKLIIINKEINLKRINLVLVNDVLGF